MPADISEFLMNFQYDEEEKASMKQFYFDLCLNENQHHDSNNFSIIANFLNK
jgi:hypothetical protein